ncbi:MAG: hypothetical protein E7632_03950 [Ruminococcaceae bacterium]|nr:hypothetical protein [Oscillospiraceae bacterium]
MKRKLSFLLVLLMLASVSCGEASTSSDTTDSGASDTSATETEPAGPQYDFGGKDYGGYEFKILNYESYVDAFLLVDPDEQNGDILNDALYKRNTFVEDKLNFTIKEIREPYTGWQSSQVALCDRVVKAVNADDNEYDAAYLPVGFKSGIITDGYLMDLNTIPELNVNSEHWDTVLNGDLTLDGKLFTASSSLNMCALELSDVLLFNEEMFENLGLDMPYDLVREGKWTLDKMYEYVNACTNLNGAESFTFNQSAATVYGIGGHLDKPYALLNGADCFLVKYENDEIVLGIEEERIFNAAEKIAKILRKTDGYVHFNNSGEAADGYVNLFSSNRAGFVTCELKTAYFLRDMETTFGLLPMPKYDEAQKDYQTSVSQNALFLTIPVTQDNTERTGTILDALTFYSYHDVLPAYYDVTLSQKGLRNEDSIEMLDIVYATRGIEFAQLFGVSTNWVGSFNNQIVMEKLNLASVSATQKDMINSRMKKIFDSFEG